MSGVAVILIKAEEEITETSNGWTTQVIEKLIQ